MRPATIIFSFLSLWATAQACACDKVKNAGLYCGYCSEVHVYDEKLYDNVYWCNKSGGCEDLGNASNCKKTLDTYKYCDGRDKWRREERGTISNDISKEAPVSE